MSVVRFGDSGNEVGEIQQYLIEAGEVIDKGELSQQLFGPDTKVAVLEFQSTHVDPQGRPLTQDGAVGPVTLASLKNPREPVERFVAAGWSFAPAECRPQELAVVTVAVLEIAQRESPPGSNRGPRIDIYTGPEWYGAPWCALFVSWAWSFAEGGSPFGKLASAYKIKTWGEKHGAILGADELARPGDVGIIMRAEGRGHVVMVVGRETTGAKLRLIEGNCANACRGTFRERAQLTCIVRPLP